MLDDNMMMERVVSKRDVDVMPTINPVRHGHWIKGQYTPGFAWFCSVCGGVHTNIYGHKNTPRWTYCPWCGAKMN